MHGVSWLLFLTGIYPLFRAWSSNRNTTLSHALHWSFAAWAAWGALTAFVRPDTDVHTLRMVRYLALCLTGRAGIAVLGARRPGVRAWNFVILGLLAVLLLPLFEWLIFERTPIGLLRAIFVIGTLGVALLNYLPTRFGPAAMLLALSCAWEMWLLHRPGAPLPSLGGLSLAWVGVGLTPWVAFGCARLAPPPHSEFDRLWLDFRDRFGLFWSQRVREQFNRVAANSGWAVHLYWQGLVRLLPTAPPSDDATDANMIDGLRSLLKRFHISEPQQDDRITR